MSMPAGKLIVIGENLNATRKIRATSPRVVRQDGKLGIGYTGIDGTARILDCTDIAPEDPRQQESFMIPHIAQALRKRDLSYITWAIRAQELAGAHVIDLCVDEMSPYPEERKQWLQWLVRTAQAITTLVLAIDSSDSATIEAGLQVYDSSKSRIAINSFNLEAGREGLVEMAKKSSALLFANAGGRSGLPQDAGGRVRNLNECMDLMDRHHIPMKDRFLDPLVFPIGVAPESGNHYVDAVKELRREYPEVHIFGGHSNVSFGLPRRSVLNHAFTLLSIMAGCDAVMIDPVMNSPMPYEEFRFATDALTARDEYSLRYLKYCRGG